jgi:Ca-activated chloride channel family protein
MHGYDDSLTSQKVLIIMTDGEDQETDPLPIAQEAANAGVLIYTIGFGTPDGEPIPEFDSYGNQVGYKVDQNGEMVVSRLDANTLQQIAAIGGGSFFSASASGSELDSLLNEMGNLQRAALESRLEATRIERYQMFLAAALVALVGAELIPDRLTEGFGRKLTLRRKHASKLATEVN